MTTAQDVATILPKRLIASGALSSPALLRSGTFHHDFSTIPIHSPLRPDSASLQSGDDGASGRLTLDELWKAVAATPVGTKLLSQAQKKPKIKWGSTAGGFHGEWDGKTIILNKDEKDQLSDNEWKQVITLELGNAANDAIFQTIFEQADVNPPSREDFIDSIELVEFKTRLSVIAAYSAGEFCNPGEKGCKAVFDTSITDFNAYRTDSRGLSHRESYGQLWDENFSVKYKKLHPVSK